MTTGAELLAAARTFEGEPYRQLNPGRSDPNSGYKDCSGDVVAAHTITGHAGIPTVSSAQAQWCTAHGRMIPVDRALHTAGALLFMGADEGRKGFGNDGHVAISGGDGIHVTEARGTAYGVLWDVGAGRNWSGAGLSPVIAYAGQGASTPAHPTPTHPPLPRQLSLRSPMMRGDDVRDVQTRLYFWAFVAKDAALNPGAQDGIFGPKTANAVKRFQTRNHLGVDGIVGPATYAKLYAV